MTFQPANSVQSFVPTTITIPKEFADANPILTDYFKKIISSLNEKDIGQYNTQELLNGQKYYTQGDNNRFRQVYRKVIQINPALAAGANNYAHGLGTITGFTFTRIYAVAQDTPTTVATPIPQAEPAAANRATSIEVVGANVVITLSAGSPYIGFTGNIILEYLKS